MISGEAALCDCKALLHCTHHNCIGGRGEGGFDLGQNVNAVSLFVSNDAFYPRCNAIHDTGFTLMCYHKKTQ